MPAQGSSTNIEAARLGVGEPKAVAEGLGSQLLAANEKQAGKTVLVTGRITILCGRRPPWRHCALLKRGGWGQVRSLSVGKMAQRGTKPDEDCRGEVDAGICKIEDGRVTRMCAHGVITACTRALK